MILTNDNRQFGDLDCNYNEAQSLVKTKLTQVMENCMRAIFISITGSKTIKGVII